MPPSNHHTWAQCGTLGAVTGELLNPPDAAHCFVCGSDNASSLGLHVFRDGTDAIATFIPEERFEGWAGRLHGGVIGLLVDEMLVYAGVPHDLWGMTANVRYWLQKPIPLEGVELTLRGRLTQKSSGGFRAVVSVHSGEVLVAKGEGMCVLRNAPPAAD